MSSTLVRFLDHQSRPFLIGLSAALFIAISSIDYFIVTADLGLSIFYVAPISILAWYVGRRSAFTLSIISAIAWGLAEYRAKEYYTLLFPIWNAGVRLTFFCLVSYLMVSLRAAYEREKQFARIDGLTQILNRRFFMEVLEQELLRSRRYHYPITLAYLDLDNFKAVNDKQGHHMGDQLLQQVARTLTATLRDSDRIARLGGDEFAVLLPHLAPQEAKIALKRIHEQLLYQVEATTWGVGFSLGAVTCQSSAPSVQDLLNEADRLMYTVKNGGKNQVRHQVI
ncbi:MAG: GGDEF domain-containing protein [Thainema sp.]